MATLVLDIGSSSVRAILFDDQYKMIPRALARRPHQFETDTNGRVTADVHHLRTLTEACIDEILAHERARQIQQVGVACFVGNLVGFDDVGHPITPLYTYADTQSREQITVLKQLVDAEANHQRTGVFIHTAYHPAKLQWLKTSNPELFAQVVQWGDLVTAFYRQWFGHHVPCSYSVASWGGLLNRETLTWDETWLSVLGLQVEQLPVLADYDHAQRGLAPIYRKRWAQLADVPFYLAVGDGAAANVGSGAINPGQVALTIGTTAALRTVRDRLQAVPEGLWSYRISAKRHLIGGATTEGGNVFQWLQNTLRLPDNIEALLQDCEPGAHGLMFMPLLAGERSPGWNAHANGTIHGIKTKTTPLDILQAALESVAIRLAMIVDQIAADDAMIYAGGNALLASPSWQAMIATAFNRPLYILDEPEVTARGVAILVNGVGTPLRPMIRGMVTPQAEYVEQFQVLRQNHLAFYERLYGEG